MSTTWKRRLKKYERQLGLAVIIFLLLIFAIPSALECRGGEGEGSEFAGSFQPTPGEQASLTGVEFLEARRRLERFLSTLGMEKASFRFGFPDPEPLGPIKATWAHILLSTAAEDSGYRCADGAQLQSAVQAVVEQRQGGMWSVAGYERFLDEIYRGPAVTFEDTVREIVRKDAFLRPLIESMRYAIPQEKAYQAWRASQERVDLAYYGLDAAQFVVAARREEDTKTTIQAFEDVLGPITGTALSMQRVLRQLEEHAGAHEGVWPDSLMDLDRPYAEAPPDGWSNPLRYTAEDGVGRLVSAGPDGVFDTEDDLPQVLVPEMKTFASLKRVGDALRRWHEAVQTAHERALRGWEAEQEAGGDPGPRPEAPAPWPETLAALEESPVEGAASALTETVLDGWDRELAYTLGEDGAPRLSSLGADGQAGTDDDLVAEVSVDAAVVPPQGVVAPLLDAVGVPAVDAWDRALRLGFRDAILLQWEARSAGADGAFDTGDDIADGNGVDLEAYYQRGEVRGEYQRPLRRRFRMLYVHLPLLPDEVFARLWETFPEHHPDEEEAYDHWRIYHPEPYYGAADPADPETGHGAEIARSVAPTATPTLVPAEGIVGPAPEGFLPEAGSDDPDAELKRVYVEKGWRPVLMREVFIERLLADLVTEAREAQEAHARWETDKAAAERAQEQWREAHALWVENGSPEGEEPEAPAAFEVPEPTTLTMDDLLGRFGLENLPGEADARYLGYYEAPPQDDGLLREEWETLDVLGGAVGPQLSLDLQNLHAENQWRPVPSVLNDTHTRAILQGVSVRETSFPDLAEVRDDVYESFLEERSLELATAKLDALRKDLRTSIDALAEGEEPTWDAWVKAWVEANDVTLLRERTGMFIGSNPPRRADEDPAATEEANAAAARRTFVRETGYETVRPVAEGEDEAPVKVGALGRTVLEDGEPQGTRYAFLVRVADRADPPKAAFSSSEYSGALISQLFGTRERKGPVFLAIDRYLGNFDWLSAHFDLEPATNLDALTP